jgi:hypothetical protein
VLTRFLNYRVDQITLEPFSKVALPDDHSLVWTLLPKMPTSLVPSNYSMMSELHIHSPPLIVHVIEHLRNLIDEESQHALSQRRIMGTTDVSHRKHKLEMLLKELHTVFSYLNSKCEKHRVEIQSQLAGMKCFLVETPSAGYAHIL